MKRRPFAAFLRSFVVCVASAGALASVAEAAKPEPIARHRDWSVFVQDVNGDKICFAATEAKDKSPSSVKHGDFFFLIASWKSGAAQEQPSIMAGYNFKDAPEPTLRIGSDKWEMYVSDNEAFIEKADEETRLIRAMRRGADMRISAMSRRGTATSYLISLRGVSAALDQAKSACR